MTTARGNEWDHRALRQLLKRPRLAGWRVHRGEIARDADGPARAVDVWEPILDQDTYDRLQARDQRHALRALSGPAWRSALPAVRRRPVRDLRGADVRLDDALGHAYICRKGDGGAGSHTVSIAGVPTDEAVSAVVVARLRGETLAATPTGARR